MVGGTRRDLAAFLSYAQGTKYDVQKDEFRVTPKLVFLDTGVIPGIFLVEWCVPFDVIVIRSLAMSGER